MQREHPPVNVPEVAPTCPICHDLGWVTHGVPVGHPDFGKVFPCRCQAANLADRRVSKLMSDHAVLADFVDKTFESFERVAGENLPLKADALQAARVFADGPITDPETGKVLPWLYLYGKFGAGKTGFAACALRDRAAKGEACAAIDWLSWVADVKRTYSHQDMDGEELVQAVARVQCLLIDELGSTRYAPSDHEIMLTERLIRLRHARRAATIITTNLNPQALVARFGTYLAERVFERSYIVEVGGASLRF